MTTLKPLNRALSQSAKGPSLSDLDQCFGSTARPDYRILLCCAPTTYCFIFDRYQCLGLTQLSKSHHILYRDAVMGFASVSHRVQQGCPTSKYPKATCPIGWWGGLMPWRPWAPPQDCMPHTCGCSSLTLPTAWPWAPIRLLLPLSLRVSGLPFFSSNFCCMSVPHEAE